MTTLNDYKRMWPDVHPDDIPELVEERGLLITPEGYEHFSGRSFTDDFDPANRKTASVPVGYKKQPIPAEVRWAVWERDNYTCKHCGSRRDLTVDHIHPESKGGVATVDNCQTLCKSCNSRKGAR